MSDPRLFYGHYEGVPVSVLPPLPTSRVWVLPTGQELSMLAMRIWIKKTQFGEQTFRYRHSAPFCWVCQLLSKRPSACLRYCCSTRQQRHAQSADQETSREKYSTPLREWKTASERCGISRFGIRSSSLTSTDTALTITQK